MLRFILGAKARKDVRVSTGTHMLIKQYAHDKGITIAEAVWRLLRIAFTKEYGIDLPENEDPKR